MAFVPIRRTRLNQPNGDGIDWSSKFADGLFFAFNAAAGGVNLVSGRKGTLSTANLTTGVGLNGKYIAGSGSGFDRFVFSESFPSNQGGFTMLVEQCDISATQTVMLFASGTLGYRLQNGGSALNPSVVVDNVNGFSAPGMVGQPPKYTLAASSRGNGSAIVCINGVCGAVFSATLSNPMPSGETSVYLPFDSGTSKISTAYLWGRELSDRELSEITANPRQIFL